MQQELELIKQADTSYLQKYNRYESVMGNNALQIDWMIGNTCNYACTYCDDMFHDGSVPWPDVDTTVKFIKRLVDHYRIHAPGKKILWNMLGGEPTVWKDFNEVFRQAKEYDPNCIVRMLTNGSRTLRYWEKNAKLFDEVIISYHPERADYVHCTEVANILSNAGTQVSIQTCLYPPVMKKCLEAAKYFHENSLASSHIAKALQVSLASDETFQYDKKDLEIVKKYDGVPKRILERVETDEDFEYFENKKKFKRKMYGHMMRFVNTDTGKFEFFHSSNESMSGGWNTWKGWKCMIGIEALVIGLNGNVTSGNSCFNELVHGNINQPDKVEFPTDGRICPQTWCSCIGDTEVTKFKVK